MLSSDRVRGLTRSGKVRHLFVVTPRFLSLVSTIFARNAFDYNFLRPFGTQTENTDRKRMLLKSASIAASKIDKKQGDD